MKKRLVFLMSSLFLTTMVGCSSNKNVVLKEDVTQGENFIEKVGDETVIGIQEKTINPVWADDNYIYAVDYEIDTEYYSDWKFKEKLLKIDMKGNITESEFRGDSYVDTVQLNDKNTFIYKNEITNEEKKVIAAEEFYKDMKADDQRDINTNIDVIDDGPYVALTYKGITVEPKEVYRIAIINRETGEKGILDIESKVESNISKFFYSKKEDKLFLILDDKTINEVEIKDNKIELKEVLNRQDIKIEGSIGILHAITMIKDGDDYRALLYYDDTEKNIGQIYSYNIKDNTYVKIVSEKEEITLAGGYTNNTYLMYTEDFEVENVAILENDKIKKVFSKNFDEYKKIGDSEIIGIGGGQIGSKVIYFENNKDGGTTLIIKDIDK